MGQKLTGIIFDFNGVLLWDTHLHEQSWRQFAYELMQQSLSDEQLARHFHGRSGRYTLGYLTGGTPEAAEVDRLMEQKEAIYRNLCLLHRQDFHLSPGAVALLDSLVAEGIPHTIATASGKPNVDFYFEHLQLARWFDRASIVYDDSTRPGKPAPDFYLQAAANLGLDPRRCVVVEDSVSGLQAAHAAGIGHVVALGPVEHHDALARRPEVDAVIASLEDLSPERLFG